MHLFSKEGQDNEIQTTFQFYFSIKTSSYVTILLLKRTATSIMFFFSFHFNFIGSITFLKINHNLHLSVCQNIKYVIQKNTIKIAYTKYLQ